MFAVYFSRSVLMFLFDLTPDREGLDFFFSHVALVIKEIARVCFGCADRDKLRGNG